MNPTVRNILAVVAGIIFGSVINMGLIKLLGDVIGLPAGVDPTDMESIKASLHLYEAKHFIPPLIAHAVGTLSGAFMASRLAVSNHMKLAIAIGVWFLIGGIAVNYMIPGPTWFKIIDLVGAYIPMAYLGGIIGTNSANRRAEAFARDENILDRE